MDNAKLEWVRSWLIKAHSDLRSARALVALSEPATDTAIYHCQQAAEKSLKGYLAFRDQPLERTHDLQRLLDLAIALDSAFASLEVQADILNPYATAFRYPNTLGVEFPSVAEVPPPLSTPKPSTISCYARCQWLLIPPPALSDNIRSGCGNHVSALRLAQPCHRVCLGSAARR